VRSSGCRGNRICSSPKTSSEIRSKCSAFVLRCVELVKEWKSSAACVKTADEMLSVLSAVVAGCNR